MQYMHTADQSGNAAYAYGYVQIISSFQMFGLRWSKHGSFHPTFMPPDMRFNLDPSDPTMTEVNENTDWRELWLSDLNRLEDYTKEQEQKGTADSEFWRMMHMRLYRAFAPDPPPMYAAPPPAMIDSALHDGDDGAEEKDADGDMEDDEEE